MAAFAAVVSLMNTIHLIQNHPRYSFSFAINQIASLSENAQIFLKFVESFNSSHQRREDLEIQIASVACLAENVLVSLTVDQIRAGSALDHGEDQGQISSSSSSNLQIKMKAMKIKALEVPEQIQSIVDSDYGEDQVQKCSCFLSNLRRKKKATKKNVKELREKLPSTSDADYCNSSDLEKVIDRMSSIVEEVMKVQNESSTKETQSTGSMAVAASTRSPTMGTTRMVGFRDYKIQLMDVLTRDLSTLQIISVLGMGGIGKTTLVKNVYDDLGIVHHFDLRAWVTVSQEYDIKDIFLQLLGRKSESTHNDTSDELGEQLHKKLWGRRYLIILDDMWSTDVWNGIRYFFPDNDNGSRIVITTRITNISSHLSSSPLEMGLLDDDESWKLFCATTFGEEEFPRNLVEIGKNIVRKCRGLPLSIVVIGGHLKKALRVEEEWEIVARNMISFLDSGEDQCLSILSLSYTHLPVCLKPCFLYMGGYLEDEEIDVSILIRFWVSEGFIQPDGARSSEEIAESYLKELIDRNLILIQKQGWNRKILKCRVHDLVREVCLKVGRKERFFCVLKHGGGSSRCKHGEDFGGSRICMAEKHWQIFIIENESRLVELLPNIIENEVIDPHYLEELFDRHSELRYIYRNFWSLLDPESHIPPHLPSSISLCWNLQTLVIRIRVPILAPFEIWEMPWLRHLDIFQSICLLDPPKKHFVMQSLQTLKIVENLTLSEDVCGRIPNIKDLHIYYNYIGATKMLSLEYCPNNLGGLQKLESLRLRFAKEFNWRYFVQNLTYPSMLQELWLENSGLHWEDLSKIGLLPQLEVFTLSEMYSVKGEEWSPIQGQFLRLRSLTIRLCCDLVCWNAESSHFPVLETLTLDFPEKLMEFPWDIGEIPTLRRVELYVCSMSAGISAIRMLEEQEQLGNEDLRLEIQFKNKEELEMVKEMVQEEGIKCNNLFLK